MKLKKAVIREDILSIVDNYKQAIVLNQFMYWTERVGREKYKKFEEEEKERKINETEDLEGGWVYKSSKKLSEETMLGVSPSTIRRYIKELIDKGYVLERKNPQNKWSNTLQYRINLIKIATNMFDNGYILQGYQYEPLILSIVQNETSTFQNETSTFQNEASTFQNEDTVTDITTETTTEITTESTKAIVEKEKVEEISDSKNPNDDAKIPYKKIVDYLNQKLDTNYRHTTQKTKTLIRARWNEGFKLVDFKTVIEKKAMEWLGDKKMEKYLRPVTLFGTKFEGYLNQLSVNNQSDNSGIKQLKELWAEAELEELEGSEGDYIL